jgi:hypothetical protein
MLTEALKKCCLNLVGEKMMVGILNVLLEKKVSSYLDVTKNAKKMNVPRFQKKTLV